MAITQTFSQTTLTGTNLTNPTSLQIGPDGRLYVSQQNGIIKVYDLTKSGDTWVASNEETITLINEIPNHDDDGDLNTSVTNRQVTGIVVEGTAENPILYVSSSDPRIGAGGSGNDSNLDTNSGIISRLTWNGTSWDKVDLVIGLPRSEENHSTNGMDIRLEQVEVAPGVFETHEIMYVMSGGHDNKGAPSNNFAYTPEYYYSAAMLRIDLTQLAEMEQELQANGGLNGGTAYVDEYVYALPTLDDPTRTNVTAVTGDGAIDSASGTTGAADQEAGDTFGGNDGRNQAKYDPDGPVQVYSPGYRNAYDVVITEAGNLYTFDNGPNNGWGGDPVASDGTEVTSDTQVATNQPNLTDNTNDSDPDNLHIVQEGTYGGHPNPTRASGAAAGLWSGQGGGLSEDVQLTPTSDPSNDPNTVWDDLPEDWDTITGGITNPIEGVYYGGDSNPGPKDESLLSIGSSTNGITEYTADNIGDGGPGTEYLATVSFNGNLTLIEVATDGTAAGSTVTDTETISVGGTPLDVTALDNGGIPGSGGTGAGAMFVAQIGADNIIVLEPGDPPGIDLDADNDGVLDKNDPLQFDPDNGTQTILQGGETLFWDFNPAAGNNPGPSGEYNIGMNGWMIDGSGEINPDVLIDDPSADLLTDLNNTIRGGAPGVVQIKQVDDGDAYQGNNTQNDALQGGFTPAADVGTFTIRVPIFNPYSSVGLDQNFGAVGFALGDGSQQNYLKVMAGVGGGVPRLQVYYEEGDAGVVDISVNGSTDADFNNAATNASGNSLFELYLTVDLTQGTPTAQAYYNYELTPGGGMVLAQPKAIGGPITLQGEVLKAVTGQKTIQDESGNDLPSSAIVTLLATSFGAETPFEANFVDMEITSTAQAIAPVAQDDEFTATPDQPVVIDVADLLANDSDANATDTLTVTGVSNAQNGSVVLDDNGTAGDATDDLVIFTPNAGFEGDATFEYTVSDGTGLNDTAMVTIALANQVLLYRINAEAETISALPGSPLDPNGEVDWVGIGGTGAATVGGASVNTGTISTQNTSGRATTGPYAVPDYVPQALFEKERYDPSSGAEMEWDFSAPTQGTYTVNLFMGNGYGGTSQPGERVFDIFIEGQLVEDDLDLSATLGHQVGGMFTYEVLVTDGNLDIDFGHVVENPLVNGIEIYGPASGAPVDTTAPLIAEIDVQPLSTQAGNDQPISVFVTFTDNEGVDTDTILGTTLSVSGGPIGSDPTTVIITGADGDPSIVAEYIVDAPDGGWPANTPYTFEVSGVTDEAGNAVVAAAEGYTFAAPVEPGDVVYRVNAGGAQIAAGDGGPAWSEDQSASTANGSANTGTPSQYLDLTAPAQDTTYGAAFTGANNTTLPDAIFSTERYSEVANPDNMSWDFVVADGDYIVNLYFAEVWTGAQSAGARVFDINIENMLVEDDFDITAVFGWNTADVRSYEVTVADGVLDIDFLKGSANNPKISAIEIVAASDATPVDSFNGTPATGDDFSNDNQNPDDVTLNLGANTLVSSAENSDSDFITFEVQAGQQLTAINLLDFVNEGSNAVFLGIQQGGTMPSQSDIENGSATLDGGLVFNETQVGNDILPLLASNTVEGAGQPTNGLSLPLGPGVYTLWFNQNQDLTVSTLELVTEEIPASTAAAEILVDTTGINGSTYGNQSFNISNTGDVAITKVTFDLSSAILPEVVFDPNGTAGDGTAKGFTPDGGSEVTTGVTDHSFTGAYEGGFYGLEIDFSDFQNGETLTFGLDVDPISIKGAASPGPNASGSVSGFELIGSTVTVEFADGTSVTSNLFDAGNEADAVAVVTAGAPEAPTIGLLNGASPSTVNSANQTIVILGTPNAEVTLLQVEAGMFIDGIDGPNAPDGYDVDPYEANSAISRTVFTGTLDSNGQLAVPVTLLDSDDEGGLNHFVAVVNGADGKTSQTSNKIVVEFDASATGPGGSYLPNAQGNFIFEAEDGLNNGPGGFEIKDASQLEAGHAQPSNDYIETSTNHFGNNAGNGETLTYKFTPETDGFIRINLISSYQGADATEENDAWTKIQLDGVDIPALDRSVPLVSNNGFYKTYQSGQASTDWKLANKNVDNNGQPIVIPVEGGKTYDFLLSERSAGFEIDKIALEFFETDPGNTSFGGFANLNGQELSELALPGAEISGRVFADANDNNVDDSEPGVAGVTVELLDSAGSVVATAVSTDNGGYVFANLADGTYSVRFPTDLNGDPLVLANQGGDDTADSDADPSNNGETQQVTVVAGDVVSDVDAGYDREIVLVGAATLEVTVNSDNVQSSNYGNNSFVLTNVGDKDIAKVEIDVTNAIFTDAVFDPFGEAGDTVAKHLTINTTGGTGVDAPDLGTSSAPGSSYLGAGGILGFEGVQLTFDPNSSGGFNSGESVGFAVDMDPNSIAGATKSTLDSGASPAWDIGGISGAELIGSTFTVTFTDGSTATGYLSGAGNQAGSKGLASQDSPDLSPTLTVNGLVPGGVGTYQDGGPSIIIDGPAGETVRVVVAKGIIQPVNNNFPDDPSNPNEYHDQLDAQLAALAASDFPANNAAEFLTVDVVLTGTPQDISGLFDFSQVTQGQQLAVDESTLPLGIVAAVIDPTNNDLPKGPVTDSIYLTHSVNADPVAQDDAFSVDENAAIVGGDVFADNGNGPDSDANLTDVLTVSEVNGVPGDVGVQVTLPSGALLTLNGDGTFDYDPNGIDVPAGEIATDTFTYTISDGNGGVDTATATISINGVVNPLDIDDDGILNTDDPFAYDGSNGLDRVLVAGGSFTQDFNTPTDHPFDADGGFTGILVNQAFDYGNPTDPAADPYGNRTNEADVSISGGTLNVLSTETDAFSTGTGTNNTLADGYQSAVDVSGLTTFEVHARASSADWLASTSQNGYSQFGITLGAGGTDDFVKLVISDRGNGAPAIQIANNQSLAVGEQNYSVNAANGPSVDLSLVGDIEFRLIVDKSAGANGQVIGQVDFLAASDGSLLTSFTSPPVDILANSSLLDAMANDNPLTGGEGTGGLAYGIFVSDWSGSGAANRITANYDFLTIRALDDVIATISVDDPTLVEDGDTGETTLSFTLSSDAPISGDADVSFILTGTTASAPDSPATVTFVNGVASIDVTVANDDMADADDLIGIELTAIAPSTGSAITATLQLGDTIGFGTVAEDDAAPMGGDDTANTPLDQALTIAAADLLSNDTDADDTGAGALTITGVGTDGADGGTANGGTVAIDTNGDVVYTPAAGFSGEDTFSYVVSDPGGNTGTATVTVYVTNVVIDATIQVSGETTYGTNSFDIALSSATSEGVTIKSIEFDIGTATMSYGLDLSGSSPFLGAAWDPTGSAGDAGAQGLQFNDNVVGLVDQNGAILPATGSPGFTGTTGIYPFADQLAGPIGPGGYRTMILNFDNFDVGEAFDFGMDIDPQSIQGASGTGEAGAVSGGEIAGTTITVTFDDGFGNDIVLTRQLELTGLNTSQATFSNAQAVSAPTLEVVGATDTARRVETSSVNHTVEVSGVVPGATVELYLVDASGYEKHGANGSATLPSDLFHGNDMDVAPTILSAVADGSGVATFDITLNETDNGAAPATVDGLFFLSAGVVDGQGNLLSALAEPAELKLVEAANQAPEITSLDAFLFTEGQAGAVFTAMATDPENDPITFDLGGADASRFFIDATTGEVTLVDAPVFTIADEDIATVEDVVQTLNISVIASDGQDQTVQDVTVEFLKDSDGDTVADLNDNAILVANTDQADSNQDGYGDVLDADINGDGFVSILDFSILSTAFNTQLGDPGYDDRADLNYDLAITLTDFSALSAQFNTVLPQLSSVDLIEI
ncbi:malectin domain-containing carbohydrate-binding protein [Tropicimonas sediminicola]|uniref:Cna protein B-type domain-containing protein n=1 Tax=Tropicimonas sediminicola TaxID=1031541 RepID=A0A239DF18_9RHOB|nr:malectin domain-containing carbohydrate-binding protein [Tropicimonas sediminicola]SNS31086.1 Cna protein B-type domain-containing protein [Tropicimonas sediminicola]